MDATEKGFLDALTKDKRDQTTRLIYADFLDEQDRPEEAARMRAWEASYQWFEALAAEGHGHSENYGYGMDEDDWKELSADELVAAGHERAEGDYGWTQYGSESLRDKFSAQEARDEYWRHWEIVTGGKRPANVDNEKYWSDAPFGCSC